MADASPTRHYSPALRSRALPGSGRPEARGRAHLRAHLAVRRRTSPSSPSPAATSRRTPAPSRCSSCATTSGELRAFRNVCRHRGSRLLSGSGECGKAIRCRYHGWTYRLDGELIGVPEGALDPGTRQVAPRAASRRASRSCAGSCSSTSTSTPTPLADQVGGPARAPRAATDSSGCGRVAEDEGEPARQLEDRRGQLPRGLPRADRPPGADAAATTTSATTSSATTAGSGSTRPLRDKPVGQPLERALPAPGRSRCPGSADETPASGATSSSIRTRRSTSTPTRSGSGRSAPTAPLRTRRPRTDAAAARARACARARSSAPTAGSTSSSRTRTSTS